MKPFITDDFLLETDHARELYHRFSKQQPIFDYHCHLPPEQIAANHQFADLADVWLGGDHYKWRAMRINGIPERFCTGDATPREKFDAWVKTLPYTLRNPLYHWSHLELLRYFGISEPITAKNADDIWRKANEQLPKLRTHDILKKFDVAVVCTTDDPADDLASHEAIKKSGLTTRVYPTFRPDKALNFGDPVAFNQWRERLEQRVGNPINSLDDLLSALRKRHDAFHALGGRLSDHGLDRCWSEPAEHADAAPVFAALRAGRKADREAGAKYCSFLMREFGRWDAAKGWTKQLHIGAQRNNNTRMRRELGPDTGYDGIGDFPQAEALVRYLDSLDNTGELPRTIVYNANPADNYAVATAVGSFAEGGRPGKVQFGSGWWFLDQQEAMEWQMNALSNLGLLRRFVGMVTDSRSFLSYPRHEYFRRTLCNLLGKDIARGALPRDLDEIGAMVSEISYTNARDLFRMDLDAKYS
ncbi:MAG TPA: glucuronate isomerase [Opitutaceae bacterium]|nr:glucuronate isomerase [Opitutaceae bacterium]